MIWANLNIIYQFLNAAHFQEHNTLTIIFMKLIFYWYRRLESPCESIKRACKDSDHLHARQFKWNHKTSASICSLCELQRYIDSAIRIKNISTNPMAWLNQHIRVTDLSLVAIDQFTISIKLLVFFSLMIWILFIGNPCFLLTITSTVRFNDYHVKYNRGLNERGHGRCPSSLNNGYVSYCTVV